MKDVFCLSVDDVCMGAEPFKSGRGIYFITKGTEILYIGQSNNYLRRLGQHMMQVVNLTHHNNEAANPARLYFQAGHYPSASTLIPISELRIFFLSLPEISRIWGYQDLDIVESYYIMKFQPRANRSGGRIAHATVRILVEGKAPTK